MIIIKSKQEIDMMRTAGKVNSLILRELKNIIKPGISTMDIDQFVEKTVKEHGMIASEKGYCDYPASACVSVNEEVVHGIPSKKRILQEGDILRTISLGENSVDITRRYQVIDFMLSVRQGDSVVVTVERDGEQKILSVTFDKTSYFQTVA